LKNKKYAYECDDELVKNMNYCGKRGSTKHNLLKHMKALHPEYHIIDIDTKTAALSSSTTAKNVNDKSQKILLPAMKKKSSRKRSAGEAQLHDNAKNHAITHPTKKRKVISLKKEKKQYSDFDSHSHSPRERDFKYSINRDAQSQYHFFAFLIKAVCAVENKSMDEVIELAGKQLPTASGKVYEPIPEMIEFNLPPMIHETGTNFEAHQAVDNMHGIRPASFSVHIAPDNSPSSQLSNDSNVTPTLTPTPASTHASNYPNFAHILQSNYGNNNNGNNSNSNSNSNSNNYNQNNQNNNSNNNSNMANHFHCNQHQHNYHHQNDDIPAIQCTTQTQRHWDPNRIQIQIPVQIPAQIMTGDANSFVANQHSYSYPCRYPHPYPYPYPCSHSLSQYPSHYPSQTQTQTQNLIHHRITNHCNTNDNIYYY
jgi:hypothetical protein